MKTRLTFIATRKSPLTFNVPIPFMIFNKSEFDSAYLNAFDLTTQLTPYSVTRLNNESIGQSQNTGILSFGFGFGFASEFVRLTCQEFPILTLYERLADKKFIVHNLTLQQEVSFNTIRQITEPCFEFERKINGDLIKNSLLNKGISPNQFNNVLQFQNPFYFDESKFFRFQLLPVSGLKMIISMDLEIVN